MATQQPDKKDLDVLRPGISRLAVIAELGAPIHTEQKDDGLLDLFVFRQGYSTREKSARAITHAALDVATLGAWELVGTPLEGATDGDELRALVRYDENQLVRDVNYMVIDAMSGDIPIADPPRDPLPIDPAPTGPTQGATP